MHNDTNVLKYGDTRSERKGGGAERREEGKGSEGQSMCEATDWKGTCRETRHHSRCTAVKMRKWGVKKKFGVTRGPAQQTTLFRISQSLELQAGNPRNSAVGDTWKVNKHTGGFVEKPGNPPTSRNKSQVEKKVVQSSRDFSSEAADWSDGLIDPPDQPRHAPFQDGRLTAPPSAASAISSRISGEFPASCCGEMLWLRRSCNYTSAAAVVV